MLLQVTNVGKSYSGWNIIRGIDFALEEGGRALLLGPSGSGKSTLLNIICGLQSPDTGEVEVDGVPIASANRAVNGDAVRKTNFGIIFQTLRLVSALSIRANLELAQRLQTGSVEKSVVEDALSRLGIAHRANARPFELSQGEAQRAAIARALVVKPRLLIADEPTSALDHSNTENVAGMLEEVADSIGAALLVATHDDRLRHRFARAMELRDGELLPC